jgi:predicted RNA binding protein YcfA (HicA-like mRNA interferase family)
MSKFPVDVPIRDVVKALERLGFELVREGNHIAMVRENPDGTRTPLTMPNHSLQSDPPSSRKGVTMAGQAGHTASLGFWTE